MKRILVALLLLSLASNAFCYRGTTYSTLKFSKTEKAIGLVVELGLICLVINSAKNSFRDTEAERQSGRRELVGSIAGLMVWNYIYRF